MLLPLLLPRVLLLVTLLGSALLLVVSSRVASWAPVDKTHANSVRASLRVMCVQRRLWKGRG
jgi:hypothetical protein